MARTAQDITDAELALLQVLWDEGHATIRRLTEVVYPQGKTAQYSTVQKLLERLEAKECVRRRRGPSAHVYEAAIDRDGLVGRRLQAVAEKLCGGSLTPLLTHLVQMRKLSDQDRRMLRDLVENFDENPKRGRRGKEQR